MFSVAARCFSSVRDKIVQHMIDPLQPCSERSAAVTGRIHRACLIPDLAPRLRQPRARRLKLSYGHFQRLIERLGRDFEALHPLGDFARIFHIARVCSIEMRNVSCAPTSSVRKASADESREERISSAVCARLTRARSSTSSVSERNWIEDQPRDDARAGRDQRHAEIAQQAGDICAALDLHQRRDQRSEGIDQPKVIAVVPQPVGPHRPLPDRQPRHAEIGDDEGERRNRPRRSA